MKNYLFSTNAIDDMITETETDITYLKKQKNMSAVRYSDVIGEILHDLIM